MASKIDFDENGAPVVLLVGDVRIGRGDWVALRRDVAKYGAPRAGFPMVEVFWVGDKGYGARVGVRLPGAKSGGFVSGDEVVGRYFGGRWEMTE